MLASISRHVPKALVCLTLLATAAAAPAQFYPRRTNDDAVTLVQSWYARYLHRAVEPLGYQAWVTRLRNGDAPPSVEAGILGSGEYFELHGNDPARFITGLYLDVLGRYPSHTEVGIWLDRYDDFAGH